MCKIHFSLVQKRLFHFFDEYVLLNLAFVRKGPPLNQHTSCDVSKKSTKDSKILSVFLFSIGLKPYLVMFSAIEFSLTYFGVPPSFVRSIRSLSILVLLTHDSHLGLAIR